MTKDAILTFDQGTTRQKVALFSLDGVRLGQVANRNLEFREGPTSWQDAESWWQTACDATRQLIEQTGIAGEQIVAISLSGRAGAGVFLDDQGKVISQPWLDNRHSKQLAAIQRQYPALPLYAATLLGKLLWLKENSPDCYNRVAKALYAKDFLLYRLTGIAATDPSSGPDSLSGWSSQTLAELEIDVDVLPRPYLPFEVVSQLTVGAAEQLGISLTPVVVGAHDGVCANIGAGCIDAGEVALTLGTHGVSRTIVATKPAADVMRFYSFPPDKHVIGANALMAGRSLDWFLDTLQLPEDRSESFARLDAEVSELPAGAKGLVFSPYLAGQISPIRNARRASFVGLGPGHGRTEMYQSVLEGASFAIAEGFLQVASWLEARPTISATGSGANSRIWVQLLANILNEPLHITDSSSEGRGAAMLAAVGIGVYGNLVEAIGAMLPVGNYIDPQAERLNEYAETFAHWQSINNALLGLDEQDATRR